MKRIIKKMLWYLAAILLAAGIVGYIILIRTSFYNPKMILGVSFDPDYARYLGLDAASTFNNLIIGEWQFKHIRLSAQWDIIEPTPGQFNFTELDSFMKAAEGRGVKIILALGQKTPRWPECHLPNWAVQIPPEEYRLARLAYITAVVAHFKDNPALEMWQVENEPFLPFGKCPAFSQSDLAEELALVKTTDGTHHSLVTDSGELSTWRQTATAAEFFGTTMYRVVWNKYLGYVSYDWLPAAFYRFKLWLAGRSPQTAYVVELQGEPWIPDSDVIKTPMSEQNKSLNLSRLQKNINYAYRVGLSRSYLWGAEWWAWLLKNGHSEISDYIQKLPKVENVPLH